MDLKTKTMIKLTEEQIINGQNEAYLKAGHNAYFGNGFNAGVEFALKQINKLPINNVSKSVNCNSTDLDIEERWCNNCGDYFD